MLKYELPDPISPQAYFQAQGQDAGIVQRPASEVVQSHDACPINDCHR